MSDKKLIGFIEIHFFSRKAEILNGFFKEQNLTHILELIINQFQQENLPDLSVTTEGLYIPIKEALKRISGDKSYAELEELVREFSARLMTDYFIHSSMSVDEFIATMQHALYKGAEKVDIDPTTIDADMEWDRIRLNLNTLRTPSLKGSLVPLKEKNDRDESVVKLIWNEEADLDYLKKVLVSEYQVFENERAIDHLFDEDIFDISFDENKLRFLIYLFRQLCPEKAHALMPGDRIVSTLPKRKLWMALADRLVKSDGSQLGAGRLKNCCSEVNRKSEYRDIKLEVETIVKKLEMGMGFDRYDTIVT